MSRLRGCCFVALGGLGLWGLSPPVPAQWRAAGVLVYDFDEQGEMQLLLARQESASTRDKKNRFRHRAWNILGAFIRPKCCTRYPSHCTA